MTKEICPYCHQELLPEAMPAQVYDRHYTGTCVDPLNVDERE